MLGVSTLGTRGERLATPWRKGASPAFSHLLNMKVLCPGSKYVINNTLTTLAFFIIFLVSAECHLQMINLNHYLDAV